MKQLRHRALVPNAAIISAIVALTVAAAPGQDRVEVVERPASKPANSHYAGHRDSACSPLPCASLARWLASRRPPPMRNKRHPNHRPIPKPGWPRSSKNIARNTATACSTRSMKYIEMEDLVVVLAKHKVGETVKIEYRRNGSYAETTAELKPLTGAPPPPGNPPDKSP